MRRQFFVFLMAVFFFLSNESFAKTIVIVESEIFPDGITGRSNRIFIYNLDNGECDSLILNKDNIYSKVQPSVSDYIQLEKDVCNNKDKFHLNKIILSSEKIFKKKLSSLILNRDYYSLQRIYTIILEDGEDFNGFSYSYDFQGDNKPTPRSIRSCFAEDDIIKKDIIAIHKQLEIILPKSGGSKVKDISEMNGIQYYLQKLLYYKNIQYIHYNQFIDVAQNLAFINNQSTSRHPDIFLNKRLISLEPYYSVENYFNNYLSSRYLLFWIDAKEAWQTPLDNVIFSLRGEVYNHYDPDYQLHRTVSLMYYYGNQGQRKYFVKSMEGYELPNDISKVVEFSDNLSFAPRHQDW